MGNLAALVPCRAVPRVRRRAQRWSCATARRACRTAAAVKEYFIGNRGLGGFVLAMTTIATYGSVSSFVGGPGQAWSIGLAGHGRGAGDGARSAVRHRGQEDGAHRACSMRSRWPTPSGLATDRTRSRTVAAIVVVFFGATMIAQFVGGAKLFEAVTGYSYVFGLVLFGVAVILFTTIGGSAAWR
ncbi:MAG: sodium:solute symporter family transporter [Eggerthellaceae bacterium]